MFMRVTLCNKYQIRVILRETLEGTTSLHFTCVAHIGGKRCYQIRRLERAAHVTMQCSPPYPAPVEDTGTGLYGDGSDVCGLLSKTRESENYEAEAPWRNS